MPTRTKNTTNPLYHQVEKIRRQYESIQGESAPLITIEHLLSNVSDSLYSSEYRFVLELLQNAVDSYRVEKGQPVPVHVRFELTPERLVVSNDGEPFSERDIERICGLVRARKVKKIGYKGIGFKSVASITENAQIYSRGCQFEFNKSYHPEYEYVWLVIPHWIPEEKIPDFIDRQRVSFVLPFHQRAKTGNLYEEFSTILNPKTGALLLFLDHLGQLELVHDASRQSFSMRKRLVKASGLTVIEGRDRGGSWKPLGRWLVTSYQPQNITPEAREDYIKRRGLKLREGAGEQLDISDTRISLAFHIDDNNAFVKKRGPLYAFFPVHQQSSGFAFTIQADFLTTLSREALAIPSPWNDWLIANLPGAIEASLETMKQSPAYRTIIYEALPLQDSQAIEKPFKEAVRTLFKRLRSLPIVLTDLPHARWVTPAEAAWLAPSLRHLLTNQDLRQLRPEKRAFVSFEVQSDSAKTFLTSKQGLGIEEVDERDLLGFLGQESWLAYKAPEWFADLFDTLADIIPAQVALPQLGRLALLPTSGGLARADDPAVFLPAGKDSAGVAGLKLVHPVLLERPKVAAFLKEALQFQPVSVLKQIEGVILPRLKQEGPGLGPKLLAEYVAFIKEEYYRPASPADLSQTLRAELQAHLYLPTASGDWQPARQLCLAKDEQGEPTMAAELIGEDSAEIFVQPPPDRFTFNFYRWLGVQTEPALENLLQVLAGGNGLASKPAGWFQHLYSYLETHLPALAAESLRTLPLIPVSQTGGQNRLYAPGEVFLPTPDLDEQLLESFAGSELVFVDLARFPQPGQVRRFLEKLGVSEFRRAQVIERFVLRQFEESARSGQYEPILLDYTVLALKTFRQPSSDPALLARFKAVVRLKTSEGEWRVPGELYLTQLYGSHDFEALLAGVEGVAFVSSDYLAALPEPALWREFMARLGVTGEWDQVPVEAVKTRLRVLKAAGQATPEMCLEIYGFLAQQGETGFLEEEALVYLPTSARPWWKPSELFWNDYREKFGELRGYVELEPAYQARRATFKALGVNTGSPAAQDWIDLPGTPSTPPPTPTSDLELSRPNTLPDLPSDSRVSPEEAQIKGKMPLVIAPNPLEIREPGLDYEPDPEAIGRWGEVYAYRWLRETYTEKYPAGSLEETEVGFKVTIGGQIVVDVQWFNIKAESMGKIDLRIVENGRESYWEVKSSRTTNPNQPLRMSMPEWDFAQEKGEQFCLLRVLGAGTANPDLILLQNPYKLWQQGLLKVEPITIRIGRVY